MRRHRSPGLVPESGGSAPPPAPFWLRTLRAVRAWFSLDRTATLVDRMIQGAPPPQLQALINWVATGCGLHLYISN
jgi:hypothetical protein